MAAQNDGEPSTLVAELETALLALHHHVSPTISPPNCPKRASVALVLRIRPQFPDQAVSHALPDTSHAPFADTLSAFFGQAWVKRGDPEMLLIKRAARRGDRWTGHVALPGGKREAGDGSDRAAGVRETAEEVGLDLTADAAVFVGNLPERVVTTAWGSVPLMVLCPFVYLMTRYSLPPLQLQPAEVGSAHWVSLRALMAPSLRTYERCDVTDRLSGAGSMLRRLVLRVLLGRMLFAATSLIPSESIYCSTAPGFLPSPTHTTASPFPREPLGFGSLRHTDSAWPRPMRLWGLTHGIVSDFISLLPSKDPLELWRWPTFSLPDLRFWTWLFSYGFRRRKMQSYAAGQAQGFLGSPPSPGHGRSRRLSFQVDMDGLGVHASTKPGPSQPCASVPEHMLEGYYGFLKMAIIASLLCRIGIGTATLVILFKKLGKRKVQ